MGGSSDSVRDSVQLVSDDSDYTASRTIAVITTPLFDVLERSNTDSHNLYAEALFKRMGHEITASPASWRNGASVLRMLIADKIGASAAESIVIEDGSGMCRGNRVSAKTLAQWVRVLARSEHWEPFVDSLATPGNGTFKKRFKDFQLQSSLHAKSGYLTGTYGLTGVLINESTYQRVVFSILVNDVPSGPLQRNTKPMMDRMVKSIDEWMNR